MPEFTPPMEDGQQSAQQKIAAFGEWKSFLESTPPNVSKVIANLATVEWTDKDDNKHWKVSRPRLQLHCSICDGLRNFDEANPRTTAIGYQFITYLCRDCGRQMKTFSVLIAYKDQAAGVMEVMKLGEYPPFGAPISARIGKLLGKPDLELYRKGMRSEAQGLGIGAATYFRRIVDNQWKQLVTEVRDSAKKLGYKDLAVFDEALKEISFSKAVDTLKDAIPQKLLILGGENPLTLLYKPLSVQLHELSDEECLQQAADIRLVLTALLENIADVLSEPTRAPCDRRGFYNRENAGRR
jgi:hypothetical protein